MPYLGAASGASSAPVGAVAAAGAAVILCISAGVVSRRKLAPKGRILRLFFLNVGAQEIRFQKRERLSLSRSLRLSLSLLSLALVESYPVAPSAAVGAFTRRWFVLCCSCLV